MANGIMNQSDVDETNITTVLAEDLSIKGTIRFKDSVMIKGTFEGEIESEGLLVVGPEAMINATISTKTLVSHGDTEGEITAREGVVLKDTAVHKGLITTPNIVMESGSMFNGSCNMRKP